jgi:phosphoenolpyruvate-protein kinase (PTS system EI component)
MKLLSFSLLLTVLSVVGAINPADVADEDIDYHPDLSAKQKKERRKTSKIHLAQDFETVFSVEAEHLTETLVDMEANMEYCKEVITKLEADLMSDEEFLSKVKDDKIKQIKDLYTKIEAAQRKLFTQFKEMETKHKFEKDDFVILKSRIKEFDHVQNKWFKKLMTQSFKRPNLKR